LRAIEDDDLKTLPGTFFYRSFVKQYAALLGVPEKEILPGIDQISKTEQEPVSPGQAVSSAVRQPDPIVQASNRDFTDRRLGVPVAVLGAVILACSGFYSWWNRPVQVQTPVRMQTNAQPSITPVPTPAVTQVSAAPATDLGGVVLSLAATERTWLSITSGGKVIFSGILQPGETKTVSGLEAARMKVGNAGGIEIQWNGKPVGPIGTSGEVKTILFTPDNLEILEPTPPPPSETL
jgi:cytoskeletal protein RodZ